MTVELLPGIVLVLFTFGATIFYILSRIERFVLPLAVNQESQSVDEEHVRFVHRILEHLSPVLPPSYGVVVLFGTIALLIQAFVRGWDAVSVGILAYYWVISGYSIFFGDIRGAVERLQNTESDADVRSVRQSVGELVFHHHVGLSANFGVVVLEFVLVIWLAPV